MHVSHAHTAFTQCSPFAIFADILYSPDDDGGTGNGNVSGTGSEKKADDNAAADDSAKTNSKKTDDAKSDDTKGRKGPDATTKAFASGLNEGTSRVHSRLMKSVERYGVAAVMDDDGELDVDATLDAIAKAKKKTDDDDGDSESQRAIKQANERARKAEQEKESFIISKEIASAIPNNAVDKDDFQTVLEKRYDIQLHKGELRVYNKNGTRARDDNQEFLSLEAAIKALAESKPHLIRADVRGSNGSGIRDHMTGTNGKPDVNNMSRDERWKFAEESTKQLNEKTKR